MIKTLRMTLLGKKLMMGATSLALLAACGDNKDTKTEESSSKGPAFASTYSPQASETTLITNARIIDGTGEEIENGSILISEGKISAIGTEISGDATLTIDAKGRYVTPGIIDIHSHLGKWGLGGVPQNAGRG